jgi:hypothetical protein
MVAKIATGEIEDNRGKAPNRAKGGKAGGRKRAEKLSAEQRINIAKRGAAARSEALPEIPAACPRR